MMRSISVIALSLAFLVPACADSVTYRVVDPDNAPLPGIEVYHHSAEHAMKTVAARTDEHGECSFPADTLWLGHSHGDAIAYRPGFAIGSSQSEHDRDFATIHLDKSSIAVGRIVDKNGKPVADAGVRLCWLRSDLAVNDQITLQRSPLQARFTTRTDRDGYWKLSDVPAHCKATIELDDPRFARSRLTVATGMNDAGRTLVAKPASGINGQVKGADGKPAAGVEVVAQVHQSDGWLQWKATTGKDGRYSLDRLSDGLYDVTAIDATGQCIARELDGIHVREGERVSAPEIKFVTGIEVRGTVIDADSKAPLPNALLMGDQLGSYLWAYENGFLSDAKGQFIFRALPGKHRVYLMGTPVGYLDRLDDENASSTAGSLEVSPGAANQLTVQLHKGAEVSGIARDEAGNPLPGVTLLIGRDWRERAAVTDAVGKFALRGLTPGKYEVHGDAGWEPIAATAITLPADRELNVTLRHEQAAEITGRVVTTEGAPMAGVSVLALLRKTDSQTADIRRPQQQQIVTDASGRFTLKGVLPGRDLSLMIESADCRIVATGKLKREGNGLQIGDTVVRPLPASIQGRIVDARGKAIAGVEVMSPDGLPGSGALTDANGGFKLSALPAGEVTLLAAHSDGIRIVKATTGAAPVTIALEPQSPLPGRDPRKAIALAAQLIKESNGAKVTIGERILPPLGAASPEVAMTTFVRPDGTVSDFTLTNIIEGMITRNPQRAAEWVPAHLPQIQNNDSALQTRIDFGIALVKVNPTAALEIYNQTKAQLISPLQDVKTGNGVWHDQNMARLAALAARLGRGEASELLGEALKSARQLDAADPNSEMVEAIIEIAGYGSLKLIEQAAPQLPEGVRSAAIAQALERRIDNEGDVAVRLLDIIAQDSGDRIVYRVPRGGQAAYDRAASQVVRAIAASDPRAALAIARKIHEDGRRAEALALAAPAQPKETAAALFREAIELARSEFYTIHPARIAAMAFDYDPALGRELFERAREFLRQQQKDPPFHGDQAALAQFAYYYARVNPGESRRLLEVEFARRMQRRNDDNTALKQPVHVADDYWNSGDLAQAMAALDTDRALAMAAASPADQRRYEAQANIIDYLLEPEPVRHTMSVVTRAWETNRKSFDGRW